MLSDAYSSTATPIRFPSLWSQFQSPASSEFEEQIDASSAAAFASPSLARRFLRQGGDGHDDAGTTMAAPSSPLAALRGNGGVESRKRRRTPIALKSSFTWATSDSPPCALSTYRRTGEDENQEITKTKGLFDGAAEEDDDFFGVVATQDAEGPTLVMRTKKRKLESDNVILESGEGVEPESEGLLLSKTQKGNDSTGTEALPGDGATKENAAKKRTASNKKTSKSAGPKSNPAPQKPKARRKIIPLLGGQQKLSNFFKS